MPDTERGLYHKYNVTKVKTGERVTDCIVLRPFKDRHARVALAAYAESCEEENPYFAADLRDVVEKADRLAREDLRDGGDDDGE